MAAGCYTTAYAAENNVGVTPDPSYLAENQIRPYGTKEPNAVWNLATRGRYNFEGVANKSCLYTNYLLTGASRVKIVVYNYSSSTLYFSVVKKGIINSRVIRTSVAANTTKDPAVFYVNLESSKEYMLYFEYPCNFSGYIQKA